MVYILIFLPLIISVLFNLLAQAAAKKRTEINQHKTSDWTLQIILRVIALGLAIGIYYLIVYLRNLILISPQKGYDITSGINIVSAIAILVIVICCVTCLDCIIYPYHVITDKKRVISLQVRPVKLTVIVYISSVIAIWGSFNYTYYKTDGTFVVHNYLDSFTRKYTEQDILKVRLNTYKSKGTFTDLIITFSDGSNITTTSDKQGAKLFLTQWHGQIERTNDQP